MTEQESLERARGLTKQWHSVGGGTLEYLIAGAIRAAVAEEREACARIAEGRDDPGLEPGDWEHAHHSQESTNIAGRIREKGK